MVWALTTYSAELLEHVDFLRDNGCDSIQGFYYSKSLTAKDFEKMLTKKAA